MQHGLRKHAKYGMSSLYRYSVCFGSVQLAEAVAPQPSSWYAQDGTEAHELADYALKNKIWDARQASIAAGRLEMDTRFEVGDRLGAVQDYLDYIAGILEAYDDAVLYVEHPFEFPSNVTDDAWGTCDVLIHIPSFRMVYVIDYKHGAGEAVDIWTETKGVNKQAMGYGTGAVEGSGHIDVDTAILVIVQPRAFHPAGRIREIAVSRDDMHAFVTEVDGYITECEKPNAPLVPYDGKNNDRDHCKFCPANLSCPARETRALSTMHEMFKTVKDVNASSLEPPTVVSMDRLAYVLAAKPFVMKWFEDYENYAYTILQNGGHVPGKKLVEAQSKRRWDGEPVELARSLMQLAETDDWDVVFPRRLINITDADKLVGNAFKAKAPKGKKKKAAEDAAVALAALTIKESSGNLVMVDIDDSRPAANRADVAFKTVVMLPPPPTGD